LGAQNNADGTHLRKRAGYLQPSADVRILRKQCSSAAFFVWKNLSDYKALFMIFRKHKTLKQSERRRKHKSAMHFLPEVYQKT
jgi:hypothetical protein